MCVIPGVFRCFRVVTFMAGRFVKHVCHEHCKNSKASQGGDHGSVQFNVIMNRLSLRAIYMIGTTCRTQMSPSHLKQMICEIAGLTQFSFYKHL